MISEKYVNDLIRLYIESALVDKNAESISTSWLVNQFMADNHRDIESDMAVCQLYADTHNRFRKTIKTLGSASGIFKKMQMSFEGYELLQNFYPFEVDGESIIIRIDVASDDLLLAKAAEFRKKGKTQIRHADELERYVKARRDGLEPAAA